jgi:hypothetical protein
MEIQLLSQVDLPISLQVVNHPLESLLTSIHKDAPILILRQLHLSSEGFGQFGSLYFGQERSLDSDDLVMLQLEFENVLIFGRQGSSHSESEFFKLFDFLFESPDGLVDQVDFLFFLGDLLLCGGQGLLCFSVE